MTDDGPPDVELSDDALALWSALPPSGAARGNSTLRTELDWLDDRYLLARNELLDTGLVQRWRGRGGSVRRVLDAETSLPPRVSEEDSQAEYEAEKDLYDPLADVIRDRWAKDMRLDDPIVSVIAHQGKKKTGGKWSRPDIVLVSVGEFALVPGKHLAVVSFEVKRGAALDVTAVYEALAHRRAATHSCVLAHGEGLDEEIAALVAAEAARHGVGLIVVEDPDDFESWDVRVEPEKVATEPSNLSSFLTVQLPAADRASLEAMLH